MTPSLSTDASFLCSDARYTLLQHLPLAVALLDGDLRYLATSQRWLEEFGLSESAVEQRSPFALHCCPSSTLKATLHHSLHTAISIDLEEPFEQTDGTTGWRQWRIAPWRDRSSMVSGIVLIAAEISDRKQTELNLIESEAKFRSLVENANDLIWSCTLGGVLTYLSPNTKDMFGYEPEELLDQAFAPLVHPEDLPKVSAFLHNIAVTGKKDAGIEFRHLRKDDSWCWVTSNVTPIKDAISKVIGFQGILRDISDRKNAERALRESEQFLRSIYDSAEAAIFVVDVLPDGEFRFVGLNPSHEKLSGLSSQALEGKTPDQILPPDIAAAIKQRYQACVDQRDRITYEECLPFDGQDTWWITTLTPLLDESARVYRLVGSSTNITERKQAEEALRQNEVQLRDKAKHESLLNCLTNQIRSSLQLDHILNTAVQEIRNFLQIDRCHFAWYYAEAEEPFWDVVSESCQPGLPDLRGQYPAKAFGPLSEIAVRQEILRLDDVATVSDRAVRAFVKALGNQSMLVLPLQSRSGVIGIVACIHSQSVRPWTDAEVEVLQAVTAQLAIALNQAELYTQSQSKAQELKQTLTELQQTQAQLVQTEKMSSLGQLVAGVAHEINNPVNFIYGNLAYADGYMKDLMGLLELYQRYYPLPHPDIQTEIEAIDLEFLTQDLPKLLSSMKVGADRIQKIVLALRTFSRMDEAEVKYIDIHEGIDSTLMILRNRLKDKSDHQGIEVIKEYGDLPQVECFAGQVNQVFMNILSNAIDALEEAEEQRGRGAEEQKSAGAEERATPLSPYPPALLPRITIRTQKLEGDRIQIRIADNGPGISESAKRRLFEPFFTTKPVGKGTGLGLSISYQVVVEKHGGSLEYHSELGKGTEFVITLPLMAQAGA
jgi:PAS domain S-box-containing protein